MRSATASKGDSSPASRRPGAIEIEISAADGATLQLETLSREIPYVGGTAQVTALRDIRERRAAEARGLDEVVDRGARVPAVPERRERAVEDIVFVELPKVGTEITTGKPFGSVESVKAVSDLYAPVSGTVTAVNDGLATAPEQVNKDAHGSWMIKITPKDPAEQNALLTAAEYDKFVSEEAGH